MTATTDKVLTQAARTILAVDNDPEMANILEVNLTHANFEVISARNGAEALIKASTERPDIILIDDELPDLDAAEICQRLKESKQTSNIPVIVVGAETPKKGAARAIGGATSYITKPFDPANVVTLIRACLRRVERLENLHPLTGLPNQIQVINELTGLIEQNKSFTAIYVDVDGLRSFNKVYGFTQGDRVIQLVAETLCEAVRVFGNLDDLVGHPIGDNFIVVSTTQKVRTLCRKIIADFDSRIRTLYKREDLERGYIEYEDRFGQKEQCAIMCLRIAVVSNERRTFCHHLEVTETATEQISYLRRFPGSNCYLDLSKKATELELGLTSEGIPYARQEIRTLQGVLPWLAFLTRELNIPLTVIKDCLDIIEPKQAKNLTPQQLNILKNIRENMRQLSHVAMELNRLTREEWVAGSAFLEEVDLNTTFGWIMKHLRELIDERRIEIKIEGVDGVQCLMVDARSLTQGLLHVLRSEIKLSAPGDQLQIRVSGKRKDFVTIELTNRNRETPYREQVILFEDPIKDGLNSEQNNELNLAKVLFRGIGGKLNIESRQGESTTLTIVVPKRWQGLREEVNALLSAAETSKKEAQTQLENLRRKLSPTVKQMPLAIKDNVESLSYKVQELLVLCNRSLFLADDLGNRLEDQQEQMLRQEAAQLAASEAILIVIREITREMHMRRLFDLDSSRRVAKYSLATANELGLSRSERQALHYAALLKDLGLVSSPENMVEQTIVPTLEKAVNIRSRFNLVWKTLLSIDFLSPSLTLISHRYTRYDGNSHASGAKGDNIPMGARILAVADSFDYMTMGLPPGGTLTASMAIRKLLMDSGQCFDSDVVSAFVETWQRKDFRLA
jgi:diguanylate cyclase (GGDEF)-like protein